MVTGAENLSRSTGLRETLSSNLLTVVGAPRTPDATASGHGVSDFHVIHPTVLNLPSTSHPCMTETKEFLHLGCENNNSHAYSFCVIYNVKIMLHRRCVGCLCGFMAVRGPEVRDDLGRLTPRADPREDVRQLVHGHHQETHSSFVLRDYSYLLIQYSNENRRSLDYLSCRSFVPFRLCHPPTRRSGKIHTGTGAGAFAVSARQPCAPFRARRRCSEHVARLALCLFHFGGLPLQLGQTVHGYEWLSMRAACVAHW